MGFVSEDGTVTGSVDVSQLDEIDPKTDEAKAQIEALKAQRDEGQAQVAAAEQRLAEGDKAPSSEPAEGEQSGTQKSSGRKASAASEKG